MSARIITRRFASREIVDKREKLPPELRRGRKPFKPSFQLTNPFATRYARERAAELVTAETDRTRAQIRDTITRAFAEKRTVDQTARTVYGILRDAGLGLGAGLTTGQARAVQQFIGAQLQDGISEERVRAQAEKLANRYRRERAMAIAQNEIQTAQHRGQEELWSEAARAGLIDERAYVRRWLVTEDELLCEICAPIPMMPENAEVAITGGLFTTGDGRKIVGPQAHPGCRCSEFLEERASPPTRVEALETEGIAA